MGLHRFPQAAQLPYFKIESFAYPAAFTHGTLGAGTQNGRWLFWPQYSLSKAWELRETYKFSVRVDGNGIPTMFMSAAPDSTVNITNPATFGKFGLNTGSNFSTMNSVNGQVIISGRFEF
jgi:hypothetical protein